MDSKTSLNKVSLDAKQKSTQNQSDAKLLRNVLSRSIFVIFLKKSGN